MLLLSRVQIKPQPPHRQRVTADQPFQPGEVYMIRYMTVPTLVTVVARTPNVVETNLFSVSVDRFDQCVLFRMGRRRRLLGMWLPWLRCEPERIIHLALSDDSVGVNDAFWQNRRCSLATTSRLEVSPS